MKLTKTELRTEQLKLGQLQKYLPTLQLKKMLLQVEVNIAQQEIEKLLVEFESEEAKVTSYASLFSSRGAYDLFPAVKTIEVKKRIENIAGIDLPILEKVVFGPSDHFLFDAPVWLDAATRGLRGLITLKEKIRVGEERKAALEKELRDVTIRVNLFEKILIPRSQGNIRKIKIFLGDQQLSAVCQAKVAKVKILQREKAAS